MDNLQWPYDVVTTILNEYGHILTTLVYERDRGRLSYMLLGDSTPRVVEKNTLGVSPPVFVEYVPELETVFRCYGEFLDRLAYSRSRNLLYIQTGESRKTYDVWNYEDFLTTHNTDLLCEVMSGMIGVKLTPVYYRGHLRGVNVGEYGMIDSDFAKFAIRSREGTADVGTMSRYVSQLLNTRLAPGVAVSVFSGRQFISSFNILRDIPLPDLAAGDMPSAKDVPSTKDVPSAKDTPPAKDITKKDAPAVKDTTPAKKEPTDSPRDSPLYKRMFRNITGVFDF